MNTPTPLYTLHSLASSGVQLQFHLLEQHGQRVILLRTHQPRAPHTPPHQAKLSLSDFQTLVQAIQDGVPARPTLDFTGGTVKLHLTERSRRPGRLSVRSDMGEVLNFSTLTPVHEEFQRVLTLAQTASV